MVTVKPKHILIAPLDWGLGHTTRCVPLIRHILRLGHIPLFAGNAAQRSFINEIFPAIENIHLDGYNVTYSAANRVAQAGIFAQLPHIARTIASEQKWLLHICATRQIDGILSDNRYGLFHSSVPSVIITHQLRVLTGMGNIADRAVQKLHYRYLDRFNEVWVPDVQGDDNLAGKLSHTTIQPHRTKYIGLLSQFDESPSENAGGPLTILLSGPEPQRSNLSGILWQQIMHHKENVVFIEGSEQAATPLHIPSHITYHKRLAGTKLAGVLQQAGTIVCRSGYSTIMDLIRLGKQAVLIPTPGQTEQEYLAKHLSKQGLFTSVKQNGFDLAKTLTTMSQDPAKPAGLITHYNDHIPVLENWITKP